MPGHFNEDGQSKTNRKKLLKWKNEKLKDHLLALRKYKITIMSIGIFMQWQKMSLTDSPKNYLSNLFHQCLEMLLGIVQ